MNKRLLLIIGGVIAVLVGVGAVFFILQQRQAPTPTPVQTATPQAEAPLRITITPPAGAITASASGSFDVLLNTNGIKIDGFQFIANLDGAGVSVSDSDPNVAGIQITPATVSGLNPVTNSVVAQGTTQVIRFAMITQSAGTPFSTTTPTKIATITFVPGTTGSIKLDFNSQNTRANKTGTTEDTLITTAAQTFTVSPAVGSVATASATIATKTSGAAVSCDAACLTDNDCSSNLSCINNSCRNPANPTSVTCAAVGTSSATVSATPKASATPTPLVAKATSTASATPKATVVATPKTATIAALPSALPQSGSVENTLYLVVAGLACISLAAFFMLRTL